MCLENLQGKSNKNIQSNDHLFECNNVIKKYEAYSIGKINFHICYVSYSAAAHQAAAFLLHFFNNAPSFGRVKSFRMIDDRTCT
ncbi:hypothetical protein IW15_20355 [Chryseobacterium soli]|uniref:Uncharacterized protein n=1 Tax=Chryseobacterium soli TaxID=445961 RepID=A0A086A117_9FLAO|nr:hypothetical protein IW15_20355 [Chryseobacterium soli]